MEINYNIERNPIITHTYIDKDGMTYTTSILCIGDPHFGRKFLTGVPKDRLGDREKLILEDFKTLLSSNVDYIIIMGDLFDKFIVTPTVVQIVYDCLVNTSTSIYILPGNHDLSKDTTKVSSFNLLKILVNKTLKNVKIIDKTEIISVNDNFCLVLDAYCPFSNTSVLSEDLKNQLLSKKKSKTKIISFGHWDSLDIIDDGWIPSDLMLQLSDLVVSGHEHSFKSYIYPKDTTKTPVLFTGSMQPYSHAEDPLKEYYVTIDEDDLEDFLKDNDTTNKCIRIFCSKDFVLSEPINCLSLSYLIKESIDVHALDEEEIETLDDSYQSKISSYLSQLTQTEMIETISEKFKEKEYT